MARLRLSACAETLGYFSIMIDFSFETLRNLGLSTRMAQTLAQQGVHADAAEPAPAYHWMRVTAVHRETVEVHDGSATHTARCGARLTRDLHAEADTLAVGDWVLCAGEAPAAASEAPAWWVVQRAVPTNQIVRRDGDGRRHAIVSNVDTALLVMGLDLDYNLQRLERYLTLVAGCGVMPVVVLTKADVARAHDPAATAQRIEQVRQRVGSRVDVLALDARDGAGVAALEPYLRQGQTLVLLGSSGTGKSTLTNNLLGWACQDTGGVREHDSRGKHTTTARTLHQLPGGACLIDTPGVRTLSPDVDAHTLGQLFDDIATLAHACRFRNCSHQGEPGCAVSAAVDPARLKNYHKLLRETKRDSMGVRERRAQLAQWKARSRASRASRQGA